MPRSVGGVALAMLAALAVCATAQASSRDPINGYRVKATPQNLEKLALAGFDGTEGRNAKRGTVEVFGTAGQLAKLKASEGINATLVSDRRGRTSAQRSRARARAAQAPSGDAAYKVWSRFDRVPGDGKEQYLELYDRLLDEHPDVVRRKTIGTSHEGRPIVALKVTKNARSTPDNSRPAVLYNAVQHSREWLAGETCARTLKYFTSQYGKDATVTRLVDTRELWFVCIANPDGYEYSFTPGNRLWRKNMADNDGDGVRGEPGDGVDPNRNFPTNWGRDDEGSSPLPVSETYRGTGPASEPETKALISLMEAVDFAYEKNDHTAAELILYPQGFQQYTPTADNALFTALAGDDAKPGIPTFDPDLGAELYITNGDTTDYAYRERDILAYTPEGTEAADPNVTGFEFADDEAAIEAEFQRHREFSLDLAKSAPDPENPDSHLGNKVEDFYVDAFAESYGDPQAVQVTAKRSLGRLRLKYRINDGATRTAKTSEFTGGERYYIDDAVYYHRVRGNVRGTDPGDQVEAWFETRDGRKESAHFTYAARSESRDKVLILAAEDYTGQTPPPGPGPKYLEYYRAALDANDVGYDVYDVDARGRRAPHPLGVLSHYEAVVWYTGDDYLTREPYQVPGTGTSRLATEQVLAVRDFLNEGGKLLYTGKNAGRQYAEGFEFKNFGFVQDAQNLCSADLPEFNPAPPPQADGCIAHNNDFLQYYLGAYVYVGDGGTDPATGELYPMKGDGDPFGPLTWSFGEDGAGNQDHSATFLVTSSILDPAEYPAIPASRRLAAWERPGAAPFSPYTGQYFMAANADDASYKRLRREIDLTGKAAADLSFRTSFDLEPDYDYVFVEVHEQGSASWTTLADANGHTSQDTGLSCPTQSPGSNWQSLHPFLAKYQTVGAAACTPTGTTGAWNAATGNSGGWQDWKVDLSAYAGKKIEVSITVATDPASLGLGLWVDDAKVTVDGATVSETSFEEEDLGGWLIGPPPAGTASDENGWERTVEQFTEGGVVGTEDTVYTGFGFEGIDGAETRATFMRDVLAYLGVGG